MTTVTDDDRTIDTNPFAGLPEIPETRDEIDPESGTRGEIDSESGNWADVPADGDTAELRGRRRPESDAVNQVWGMVDDGHGFIALKDPAKGHEVIPCRYCRVGLPTAHEETPCEFAKGPADLPVRGRRSGTFFFRNRAAERRWVRRGWRAHQIGAPGVPDPGPESCGCNGCLTRRGKLKRKAGRAQQVCGDVSCRKARAREDNQCSRRRAKLGRELLDHEVAGIRAGVVEKLLAADPGWFERARG